MNLASAQWIGAGYIALCAALTAVAPTPGEKSSRTVRMVRIALFSALFAGVFALIAAAAMLRHFAFTAFIFSGNAVFFAGTFVKTWRTGGVSRSTLSAGGNAGCWLLLAIAAFVPDLPFVIALLVAAMVMALVPFAVFAVRKRRGKDSAES